MPAWRLKAAPTNPVADIFIGAGRVVPSTKAFRPRRTSGEKVADRPGVRPVSARANMHGAVWDKPRIVAPTFLSAGNGDFPVASSLAMLARRKSSGGTGTRNWKVP